MSTKTKAMKANGIGMSKFQEKALSKEQQAQVKGGDGSSQDGTTGTDWVGNEDQIDS